MDIIKAIAKAGVVGAGGAGFPTHIKLNTKVSNLIVNGIECEPLLETDKYYMRHYADELIKSIELVAEHLGAQRRIIGVKKKNTDEIRALQRAITDNNANIELAVTQNYYPAGDEQMLVKEAIDKIVPPAGIPLNVDTVVTNICTLLDISNAMSDKPVTSRVITVTGAVKKPTLIEVPIGTSIRECIELAGGVGIKDYTVIMGGPMMGSECRRDEISKTYVTKTLGGLIVLPEEHVIISQKRLSRQHIINRAASACIQCRMCTDLCPRYLNGHPLYPHKVMRAIGNGEKSLEAFSSAMLCCECGVCELYACPMKLSPKTVNQMVKSELISQGYRYQVPEGYEVIEDEMREYRKVQTERLISRIDLTEYEKIHLDNLISYEPNEVIISLKQHIGRPAVAIVSNGDMVLKGECIARMEEGILGASIHASISGRVTVTNESIKISGEGSL